MTPLLTSPQLRWKKLCLIKNAKDTGWLDLFLTNKNLLKDYFWLFKKKITGNKRGCTSLGYEFALVVEVGGKDHWLEARGVVMYATPQTPLTLVNDPTAQMHTLSGQLSITQRKLLLVR